ncbi:MAG: 2-oxoglutarate dehydrogenase complex dihydrolipoyllysine-residue succinyltransferase [Desulfosarcinaceae bacterium]
MAAIEVKVPSVGESVQEAVLTEWFKKDGEYVEKDEALFVIETDKVTLEVSAETSGILRIKAAEGDTVAVGAVVAALEPGGERPAQAPAEAQADKEKPAAQPEPKPVAAPPEKPAPEAGPAPPAEPRPDQAPEASALADQNLSPAVRRLVAEKRIDPTRIKGSGPGGRITKGDVLLHLEQAPAGVPEACVPPAELDRQEGPAEIRKAMTPIRKRIAARLLEARQNTAMLTTFNDIDLSRCMAVRSQYKEGFKEKHKVSLGFMSFFIRACVDALAEIPEVNAFIEGDQIVYHNYQHIGVAIGSGRGLVVPVIRHAEQMSFAQLEQAIIDYVAKIKENRLELADLEGGTFTISNGGVYGSLLSTPILNTPQSAILGMHRIEKRPVVVDDQIVVRPMMYVALSYDHRIIDGREAVTFLKRVKELVENPERILLEV